MARANGQKDFKSLIIKDMRNMTFMVLLLLSLAVGGTLAYISATSDVATNAFAAASAPIPKVLENGEPVDDHENTITPTNGTFKKVVQVNNDGADGFVRVRLTLPQQVDDEGAYVSEDVTGVDDYGFIAPSQGSSGQYEVKVGKYTLTFGSTYASKWAYKNGWFYYKGVLAHGATTDALLSEVACTDSSVNKIEVGVIVETMYKDASAANEAWDLSSPGLFATDGSWSS